MTLFCGTNTSKALFRLAVYVSNPQEATSRRFCACENPNSTWPSADAITTCQPPGSGVHATSDHQKFLTHSAISSTQAVRLNAVAVIRRYLSMAVLPPPHCYICVKDLFSQIGGNKS